jgi:predicted Fe-Mo cluster-binding NifX family protein
MSNKKIAIPVSQGKLALHFGHCREFKFFTVEDETIREVKSLTPPPHAPGVIPQWVSAQQATDIIAGGMGQRAIQIFNQQGVNVFVGAPSREPQAIVEEFLSGNLETQANLCDH